MLGGQTFGNRHEKTKCIHCLTRNYTRTLVATTVWKIYRLLLYPRAERGLHIILSVYVGLFLRLREKQLTLRCRVNIKYSVRNTNKYFSTRCVNAL